MPEPPRADRLLPTGTVTFLFTDIEGSTRLWETQHAAMQQALALHDAIMRDAIEAHDGYLVKTTGDGAHAAFGIAANAVAACLAAQRALTAHPWGELQIKSRMGLHSGAAELRDDDYFGPTLNRAARLMAAAHGGQILLSLATQQLVRDQLPAKTRLRDMGERRLKDLIHPERVYQIIAPDLPADFPPLKTLDARPNNLPAQTTPFIGREHEIRAIKEQLFKPKVRLLTLSGVGGTGKTRLALQAAAELVDDFEHGVFFVALAALSDPELVLPTIAHAFAVREAAGKPVQEHLEDYLREKQMLLVLDNFEQVVDAAPRVSELLTAAPRLKILVTSREVLRLSGETDYPIPPLSLPDPKRLPSLPQLAQYEAVALFIERAVAVKSAFTITNENAPAVAAICHRLDGLPLAIELAAARVRVLPPQRMLAELGHRLSFVMGGARDLPARQRTLRSTIDWSHDLLTGDERQLFRQLAVFVGGCTLDAIEAVCNLETNLHVLETVESLVDKNLVKQTEDDGEPRFAMLETIREYAAEKLAEAADPDSVHDRHLDFYLTLADGANRKLVRGTFTEGIEEIERERENLLAAQAWCNADPERASRGLRLVFDLQGYWDQRAQYGAGLRMATVALNRPGAGVPTLERGQALLTASLLAYRMGDYDQARDYAAEGVTIVRSQGPRLLLADALIRLAHALIALGDIPTAQEHIEERLALVRAIGDERRIASTLNSKAELHRLNNELELAVPLYEEALALALGKCDPPTLAICQLNVALVSLQRGDTTRAHALLREALSLVGEPVFKHVVAIALDVAFALAIAQGDWTVGARLLGASEAQQAETRHPREAADAASLAPYAARMREALGEATFSAAYTEGRALSYDDALAETLAWLDSRDV